MAYVRGEIEAVRAAIERIDARTNRTKQSLIESASHTSNAKSLYKSWLRNSGTSDLDRFDHIFATQRAKDMVSRGIVHADLVASIREALATVPKSCVVSDEFAHDIAEIDEAIARFTIQGRAPAMIARALLDAYFGTSAPYAWSRDDRYAVFETLDSDDRYGVWAAANVVTSVPRNDEFDSGVTGGSITHWETCTFACVAIACILSILPSGR
jgi:hypothetical protein